MHPTIQTNPKFKTIAICAFVGLINAAMLSNAGASETFEANLRQYGDRPVDVVQESVGGRPAQEWKMEGISNGQIEMVLPSGGGISLAPSRDLARSLRLSASRSESVRNNLRAGLFSRAADDLRPSIYPLFKFAELSNEFSAIFDPIAEFIQVLGRAEAYDEINAILDRFPALLRKSAVQRQVFIIVRALSDGGSPTTAVDMLRKIPVDALPDGVENILLSFAYDLRVKGEFEALIPVYEAMIPELSGAQQLEAQIWLAYCLTYVGRSEEADALMETLPTPSVGEEGFGLYQMLIGYAAANEGDHKNALDALSQGVIYANPNEAWLPEANYLLGLSYRALEMFEAAENTFLELSRLRPDDAWGQRAGEALEQMKEDGQATDA